VPAPLIVGNDGIAGRIRAHVHRVAVGPATARLQALRCRTAREERDRAGEHLGRQRPERRDVVHDPDPAAVRGDHEVVVAGVNGQIAHRDSR